MEESSLSLQFDDLMHRYNLYLNNPCSKELIQYVSIYEKFYRRNVTIIEQYKRLQTMVDKMTKNVSSLELKLSSARRLLDTKKKSMELLKEQRDAFKNRLEKVKKSLDHEDVHLPENVKKDIVFLCEDVNSFHNINQGQQINVDTSPIDMESSPSNFSDISFSHSEDDLNEISRRSRTFRKHIPFFTLNKDVVPTIVIPADDNNSANTAIVTNNLKRISDDVISNKHLKKIRMDTIDNEHNQQKIIQILDQSEHVLSKPITLFEEAKVLVNDQLPILQLTSSEENCCNDLLTPVYDYKKNLLTCKFENVLQKICSRDHCFIPKTVYMANVCNFCCKRIIFGKRAFKCIDCHVFAHTKCKNKIPLPCIPTDNSAACITICHLHDYTSIVPPMVPALIIHCVCEIERRGMSEIGLYRVSGSEKNVRMLTYKFMRNKGIVPELATYDIASICGCIKIFLSSLHDTLIPKDLYINFTELVSSVDQLEKIDILTNAISNLPLPNRSTLAVLILHLQHVAALSASNKMSLQNLAKIFAPTIIVGRQTPTNSKDALIITEVAISIMEELLNLPNSYWISFISDDNSNHL